MKAEKLNYGIAGGAEHASRAPPTWRVLRNPNPEIEA